MNAFMGMRGTGDWASNQLPEGWAQYILYEYPNGSAPMFAIQSMFPKKSVDNVVYNYWTKTLPLQAGDIAGIYINSSLSTAYSYSSHASTYGQKDAVLYVKVAESFAKECKPGHIMIIRDSDQFQADVRGRIIDVSYNGSSSVVAVKLVEDDGNHPSAPSTYNISTADRALLMGSGYPEGSTAPEAIAYDPVQFTVYAQEFRDTLDITDIAAAVALRTGDAYKEAKRECAELHAMGIEKAGLWGQAYNGIGENGKPLRLCQGLVPFVQENAPNNVSDYRTDSGSKWAGKKWLEGGKYWLNTYLAQLFRYLNGQVMAFVGDGALLAIQDLAEAYGQINLAPKTTSYGIEIVEWRTPFGTVNMKTHPLMSHETSTQNMMILFHPKNTRFAPLVTPKKSFDTQFEKDMQIPGQHSKVDGFYTVGTWMFFFPNQFMVLDGFGQDNTAS